mmetsp:Transcript_50801/g.107803  ORF Transcript_50801/g.107803 Transcript_50801/m.107803 type:complete len:242 (-) Transcript_50801:516-1241(-)
MACLQGSSAMQSWSAPPPSPRFSARQMQQQPASPKASPSFWGKRFKDANFQRRRQRCKCCTTRRWTIRIKMDSMKEVTAIEATVMRQPPRVVQKPTVRPHATGSIKISQGRTKRRRSGWPRALTPPMSRRRCWKKRSGPSRVKEPCLSPFCTGQTSIKARTQGAGRSLMVTWASLNMHSSGMASLGMGIWNAILFVSWLEISIGLSPTISTTSMEVPSCMECGLTVAEEVPFVESAHHRET